MALPEDTPGPASALSAAWRGEAGLGRGKALPRAGSLGWGRLLRSPPPAFMALSLLGERPLALGGGGRAGTRPSLSCRPTVAAPFGRREAAASTPSTAPRWPTVSPTRPDGARPGGRGGRAPLPGHGAAARPAVTPPCPLLPPAQGTPPSRAAPCPAWIASPASWTVSPRQRSRGCPSATPPPSRPAPASTRGRRHPGRRCPDGPTRRYEGPEGRTPRLPPGPLPCPASPANASRESGAGPEPPGPPLPSGLQAKPPGRNRPRPAGQGRPRARDTRAALESPLQIKRAVRELSGRLVL